MHSRHSHDDDESSKSAAMLKSCGRSTEVTGLGIIASLVIAFGTLVGDGTILFSQYVVFLALMAISAGGIVWRLCKLAPDGTVRRKEDERVQPGLYRVSFGGR